MLLQMFSNQEISNVQTVWLKQYHTNHQQPRAATVVVVVVVVVVVQTAKTAAKSRNLFDTSCGSILGIAEIG